MRRFLLSLACLAFGVSLHASIPSAPAARFNQGLGNVQFAETPGPAQTRQGLPVTAAPAGNQSFYAEFYGSGLAPAQVPRQSGLFHWLANVIKKTAQKVNLIPN